MTGSLLGHAVPQPRLHGVVEAEQTLVVGGYRLQQVPRSAPGYGHVSTDESHVNPWIPF